ncbi:MAG: septum formation protein Maf [Kofleriaceae bacterium]|nr:septum formation protein Maf [Kofleriaceae bacterium]MCB9573262.1 septum formation protein Maf [Kofleriaceae bacterium]
MSRRLPPGPLVLASASPRRRELLERVGVAVEVRPADVDEAVHPGEAPLAYARRVAAAKAATVAAAVDGWVLAADTIVELDGEVLGKADDAAAARAMLARLRGRTHRVTTAFVLRGPRAADGLVTTEVTMVGFGDADLDDYVASGEWRGKAGAYAVQGIAGALVAEIRGSISNVVGLPLVEVLAALAEAGAVEPRFAAGRPA